MYRALLAQVLVFTILAANVSQLFVYAAYEWNQDYISSEICINREKPQLHCNGKCYLMKKLKQAEQKEKNRDREEHRTLNQQGIVTEKLTFSAYSATAVQEYSSEIRFRLPLFAADIFQPPRA